MYLWSIDIDAVLTAMSCFRLLCEEAEIRCGADELAVTQLLPNYSIYSELAAASTVLTTGQQPQPSPLYPSLFLSLCLWYTRYRGVEWGQDSCGKQTGWLLWHLMQ